MVAKTKKKVVSGIGYLYIPCFADLENIDVDPVDVISIVGANSGIGYYVVFRTYSKPITH